MPARLILAALNLAFLLAVASAHGAEPDFSLTSDIERRFQPGALDSIPEIQPLLQAALPLTRHAMGRGNADQGGHRTPSGHIVFNWSQYAPRSIAWRNAHLEDDTDRSLARPTMVEATIAKGFPEGRTADAGLRNSVPVGRDILMGPARDVDAPTEPAANHLALHKLRPGESKSRIVTEAVAMRFVDEGANQYR
jgi:hypothetical protein